MKKLTIILFIVMIGGFGLSAGFAHMAPDNSFELYGNSIVEKIIGADFKVTKFSKSIDGTDIENLEINLPTNDIKVVVSPDQSLHFQYNGKTRIEELEKVFKNNIKGKTMTLNLEGAPDNSKIQISSDETNGLTVKIPANITSIHINTVSGNIKVSETEIKTVKINTVSGSAKIIGNFEDADFNTVSGNISIATNFDHPKIMIKTLSGDTKIAFKNSPNVNIEYTAVSGVIKIKDFGAEFKSKNSLSGYKIGAGEGTVSITTTSGDAEIKEWKN